MGGYYTSPFWEIYYMSRALLYPSMPRPPRVVIQAGRAVAHVHRGGGRSKHSKGGIFQKSFTRLLAVEVLVATNCQEIQAHVLVPNLRSGGGHHSVAHVALRLHWSPYAL